MSKASELMKKEAANAGSTSDEIKKDIKEEVKSGSEDKVELSKDEFSSLMSRLTRLEKTANKARTSNYDKANQEDHETIYKLRTIDGKVIIGWSGLITNEANIDPETKKYHEDQSLEVEYENGEKEKMTLVIFNRRYKYIYPILKEERLLRDKEKIAIHGNRVFTLLDEESNQEYVVGEKFVN